MEERKHSGSSTSLATETLVKQTFLPEEVRRPFVRSVGYALSTEQMLWREVAARMTLDACGVTPETINVTDEMDKYRYARYRRAVLSARSWFMSSRTDSDMVFEMAGVDIFPVRMAVSRLPALTAPKSTYYFNGRKGHHVHAKAA